MFALLVQLMITLVHLFLRGPVELTQGVATRTQLLLLYIRMIMLLRQSVSSSGAVVVATAQDLGPANAQSDLNRAADQSRCL